MLAAIAVSWIASLPMLAHAQVVLLDSDIQSIVTAPLISAAVLPETVIPEATSGAPTSESSSGLASGTSTGPRFVCQGMNPMWTLKIENTHMELNQSGFDTVRFSAPDAAPSQNSGAAVMHFSGDRPNSTSLGVMVVNARLNGGVSCSDGHSDQEYEYSTFFSHEGRVFDGCCWIERAAH